MQQARPSMERDPCPDRILDDIGASFGMGAVGGSFFHFVKGLRNSPSGARFAGGMEGVRMNAPRVAGGFAVWCGLFSACDCALVSVRQKEDPYNSIIAGAATGGILAARQGLRVVARASLQGAVLLALVSSFGIMMNRLPDAGSMPVNKTETCKEPQKPETFDVPSTPPPSFEYK
ncbi:mitochondrial import inner membrane translocase subunit TIM17-2-like [Oryza glaberrima]|uniref:Mitochondrial import inner membrane translocase subunit TIM17 n=1 Tax=Oryza barthii TaxID=65489 RepID=A0A0D3GTA1_9ORYZ|nr:mitochondrial import inner membrane translocase subunit TIM17-2-like [Oryza glaberrima]